MTSEQLEREAERNRARLNDSLDELRERLTPGELLDGALAYSKDGGAAFVSNLGEQISSNPLPVTLVGVGLAWFLMSKGKAAPEASSFVHTNTYRTNGSYRPESYGENGNGSYANGMSDMAGDARDSLKEGYDATRDAASGIADRVSDTASRMSDGVSRTASRVSDRVSDTASSMSDSVRAAGAKASDALGSATDTIAGLGRTATKSAGAVQDAAGRGVDFLKDQPLIVTAIGLALGAAIGALLPSTETENELMGETADDVKAQAKDLASEHLDKAKDLGGELLNKATDAGRGFVDEAVDHAREGVQRMADDLDSTKQSDENGQDAQPDTNESFAPEGQSQSQEGSFGRRDSFH